MQPRNNRDSRPWLRPNKRKILESILHLISEAEQRGTHVTRYEIIKSLFLADRSHLNMYGRPITFDNYYAMRDGPVPSEAKKMLMPAYAPKDLSDSWPLWAMEPSPQDGRSAYKYVRPTRKANSRVLSATDISALNEALSNVKAKTFAQVREETHLEAAWIEAWKPNGGKESYHMDYALMLDAHDPEAIEDIVFASRNM